MLKSLLISVLKLVYVPIGQSNMHLTLNLYPDYPGRIKCTKNKSSLALTVLILYILPLGIHQYEMQHFAFPRETTSTMHKQQQRLKSIFSLSYTGITKELDSRACFDISCLRWWYVLSIHCGQKFRGTPVSIVSDASAASNSGKWELTQWT